MKWLRTLLALMLLGAAACTSPVNPRYPSPGDGDDTDTPPPDEALVLPDQGGVTWA